MSPTKTQFLILVALVRCPMRPYALRQEIVELTGRQVWPSRSTLRTALNSLLRSGFIEECQSDPRYWLKTKRGAPYELTEAGYWKVRRELSMYHEIMVKSWKRLERFDR